MTRFCINCIHIYQRITRALIALRFPLVSWSGCRQWPTCSEYTIHSMKAHGVARGIAKGLRRVATCY